ncbi:MAG: hypothetical protein VW443_02380 [Pseudomonadales bacterium]
MTDKVLGVPVEYLEHYSMFSALAGCEDVFVHPEDDRFTFPDGEAFPCKLLDQALFEYHSMLGRKWLINLNQERFLKEIK